MLLTTAPVLSYVDTKGNGFVLNTDASNVGLGSVLHQLQDGEEKVIGYFSRCLTKAERKYCTTREELLAVASVKHFHHYLYGQEFVIRSAHGRLWWILNFRNTGEGQLARFLETLSAYSFQLKYRAMSRRPCYADNRQYYARYKAKYQPNLTIHDNFEQSMKMKKVEGVRVANITGNECSENSAPCKFQNENNLCTKPKVTIDDIAAMENLNCEQVGTANENVSKETALSASASICISQDNDPVACIGPLFSDDKLAGREACTTSTFGQRVLSGVSEITPREVTDRAPPPVRNTCNDTVDERTKKIQYVCCCRPYISCCQMAHYNDDWLDSFEGEPLFGCLFGSEEHEGAEIFSEVDTTNYDTMISHNKACERNSGPSVE